MKSLKNENGYALLMVLMLILLFTVLGMGLLAVNMNAAKQFNMKEEQVQARHQAEMGVLHYKEELDSVITRNRSKKIVLCSDLPLIVKNFSLEEKLGYEVNLKLNDSCYFDEGEFVVKIISTGKTQENSVTKEIEAEIRLSNTGEWVDNNNDSNNGSLQVPKKPVYPEAEWEKKTSLTNLDNIKSNSPAKVIHGITSKEPLVVNGFTEIVGSLDINKKSTWTFNDHLLVAGSMATNTAGSNISEITIKKDLYIGGALHIKNHTILNVDGNLIVMGDVDFGTKTILTVKGNALFDYKVSNIDTHSEIVIENNAFFKKSLGTVKNKADFCVKGKAYLWKKTTSKKDEYGWSPYLKSDPGYDGLNVSCLGTAFFDSTPNWEVLPEINAIYK